MRTLKVFNEENVTDAEAASFYQRTSVRAIVVDADKKIGLLYSSRFGFYEFPGGGVERGETTEQAVVRECKEEAGCTVQIICEVGRTIEMRKASRQVTKVYCYIVKVVGPKGEPQLMPDELADGLSVHWVGIEEVRGFLFKRADRSKKLYHNYMANRALVFFDEAMALLDKNDNSRTV